MLHMYHSLFCTTIKLENVLIACVYLRFITLSAIAALNNIKVIGYYYIDIGLNLNHYEEFKKIFSSGVLSRYTDSP